MNRWLLAGVLAAAGAVMVALLVVIVAVLVLGVESRAFIASRNTPVSETDKVPIATPKRCRVFSKGTIHHAQRPAARTNRVPCLLLRRCLPTLRRLCLTVQDG